MCGPAPSATVVSRLMNYKRAPRDQSALAGKLERGGAFALRARGWFDRFQCSLRPDPAPLRFWVGSAGSVRARRERWDRRGFPALSRWGGSGCRRSYARRGPIPLRCGFGWAPRDQALRSQGSSGKDMLSRYARGGGLIASNACFGLIPLRCGFCGLRGTRRFWAAGRTRIREATGGWRRSR